MLDESSAIAITYQVLDELLTERRVSASSRGAMFAVVDSLRACGSAEDHIRRAENISVEIHKLEWALQRRDAAASRLALDQLRGFAAGLLDARIRVRH
jgi:hypothetical protein